MPKQPRTTADTINKADDQPALDSPEARERREAIKTGLLAGSLAALPAWMMPALADGEELVPFSDMPADFARGPAQPGAMHYLDTRQISSFYTNNADFYVVQHYGQPDLDPGSFELGVTGLVKKPQTFPLEQLKRYRRRELDVGFECGGNQDRLFHGLIGNARWAGVRLDEVLDDCGIKPEGTEVVFFGADVGEEEIRGRKVQQHFGRSLSVEDAMNSGALLAYEMNGAPLPLFHGKPLRLIVPGWYGVANVKWLSRIHVQDTRYMGRFMARDYVTLKRDPGKEDRWVESSVGRMNLKSVITRLTRRGDEYTVSGFALNDGTPLKSIEVKIDDGPWRPAQWHEQNGRYSWKLFSCQWTAPAPGEHTLVSRVTDKKGNVQPELSAVPEKATYWENYAQVPRTVII
ncbi:sulfite oxidase [Gilvimarinus sp. F26214L]|uniref:sulfite oxidase n=1 Tax=Gilvimarinus sp. DZF01 TaxID=3461371 RepID=UPI004045EB99